MGGDHHVDHTIPLLWLDDRSTLLRYVNVRPAAGWSALTLHWLSYHGYRFHSYLESLKFLIAKGYLDEMSLRIQVGLHDIRLTVGKYQWPPRAVFEPMPERINGTLSSLSFPSSTHNFSSFLLSLLSSFHFLYCTYDIHYSLLIFPLRLRFLCNS